MENIKATLDDYKLNLSTHVLEQLEMLLSHGHINMELCGGYIKHCNTMIQRNYPVDKVRYITVLQSLKNLSSSEDFTSLLVLSMDIANSAPKLSLKESLSSVIDKIFTILQKQTKEGEEFETCKKVFDVYSGFIREYSSSIPNFWELEIWNNISAFDAGISSLKSALEKSGTTQHQDEMVEILLQMEEWRTKILASRDPSGYHPIEFKLNPDVIVNSCNC